MAKSRRYDCRVPVTFFKEGAQFVAYCPVLDLSTCGKTFDQAQHRFEEALELFIEDLAERGTLDDVLSSYGWKKVATPSPHWTPPMIVGQIEQEASIPVPA